MLHKKRLIDIIVSFCPRRGTLNSDGQRTDVDKELFVIMSVLNENLSWYLEENVERFAPGRKETDYE